LESQDQLRGILIVTNTALIDAPPAILLPSQHDGRWLNALLLTAVMFLALVPVGSNLLSDPDSQWHVAVGSKIWSSGHLPQVDELSHTFAGSPWIATQWLSELVLFGAFSLAGWSGVVALTAFMIAVTFGLLLYWLEGRLKWSTALSIALAVVPAASSHYLARPEVFALPLLILFMGATIDAVERRTRPPLWLVPLMALWANLHGSFPIAFVAFAALGAEALFSAESAARAQIVWRWGMLFLLLIAATGLTPYGFRSSYITFFVLSDGEAAKHLEEWQPIFTQPVWFAALMLFTFAACLAFTLLDWRRSPFRAALVLSLGLMMVRHARFANIFAFMSAFVVAYPIRRVFPSLRPSSTKLLLPPSIVLGLAALVVVAGLVLAGLSHPEPPREVAPRDALNAARRLGLTGPVFNDFNFNGFLLASGLKTFIDGRTDQLFVHGFMDKLSRALADEHPDQLLAMLSEYKVSWALVENGRQADAKLGHSKGWEEVYKDDIAIVYRKIPVSTTSLDRGNL
jgi:hypothetical protein